VNYETVFSIGNPDDYKRCICYFFGDGELDCLQEDISKCSWTDQLP